MSFHCKLKASLRTAVLTAEEGEEEEEDLCVKYFKCLKGSSGPPQDYLRLTRDGIQTQEVESEGSAPSRSLGGCV